MAYAVPSPASSGPLPVAIIGAGIGGLTLAWHLERAGVAYELFEAEATVAGGTMRSRRVGPYLLEVGPNSLQLTPALAALIDAVGLSPDVVDTAPVAQHRYVWRGGRFRKLPGSPPALLASGYFGLGSKLRLVGELLRRPSQVPSTATLTSFFADRFGPEVVEYALAPFVAGVWAGDPDKLLLHHTMPRLAALVAGHGSLLRGLMKAGSSTGRRRIVTFRHGAEQLPLALAADLHHLHMGTAVRAVRPATGGGWVVELAAAAPGAAGSTYRAVVLALPTWAAAPLLAPAQPAFATALAAVRYPAMAVVHLAWPRNAVAHPLNGFGALHPRREQTRTAGAIWTSALFPARCPADEVLLTVFVGGDQFPQAADLPDAALLTTVEAEVRRLYGVVPGVATTLRQLTRWPRAIPQFDEAIAPVRAALPALAVQGLHVAANWAAGAGVPDIVAHAGELAAHLGAAPTEAPQ